MKNNKTIKYLIIALVIICASSFAPSVASAASVYTEATKGDVSVGDTILVGVKVDSDKAAINSIEGDVTIQSDSGAFEVKEFSLAGSIFGLWPRTPSLSSNSRVISFVGGVPGGFNVQGARLFNIVLEVKKEGNIKISPRNIVAFSNDGNGTKIPVNINDITIKVIPRKDGTVPNDEWSTLLAADITPPEPFVVVLGKDPSLFEGKKFAFFSAMDAGSGVSHYEVSENGKPAVRSGSMYVLQDQDSSDVKIKVTAYDKSGNKRAVDYVKPGYTIFGFSWVFFAIVALMLVVWYFRRKRNKRMINKINAL